MSNPRKGFTLIELLVVVAIIALLISILLPSLSKARQTARTVACLSIQKQYGTATLMYADANDRWTVPFNSTNPYRAKYCRGGGFWGAYIAFRQNLGFVIGGSNNVAGQGQTAPPGMICPSKPSQYIERGHWYRSFAFNAMGSGVNGNNKSVNLAKAVLPAVKVLGMDAANWSLTGSSQTRALDNWDIHGDDIPGGRRHLAYRHNEMTNMLMHDGHAATFTKDEAYNPTHRIRITMYDPYKF